MNKPITLALCATLALSACATAPQNIAPTNMSAQPFMGRSCASLASEYNAASSRLQAASQAQEAKANSDAAMTAVSLILFWPAMFAVQGDNGNEVTIAEAKGRLMAIEEAMMRKGC